MKSKSKKHDQRRSGNRSSRRQEEIGAPLEESGPEHPPTNRPHPPVPSCVIRLGPQRREATIYRPSDRLVTEEDDESCRIVSSTGLRDVRVSPCDVTTSQCDVIKTCCDTTVMQSRDSKEPVSHSAVSSDNDLVEGSSGIISNVENKPGELNVGDTPGTRGAVEESRFKGAKVGMGGRNPRDAPMAGRAGSEVGDDDEDDRSGISEDKDCTSVELRSKRSSAESPTEERIVQEEKTLEPSRCNQSVSTDPDLLGPCDPGSAVVLEGIVWNESRNGLLVVNVTWRGKTYVGTLMDSTAHQWASPSFRDDFRSMDPSNGDDDGTSGEGRRLRRGCRAGTTSARSSTTSRSSTASKRASEPTSPSSKSPQSSGLGGDQLLSCPEPMCDKKFKHRGALTTHRQRTHKSSSSTAAAVAARTVVVTTTAAAAATLAAVAAAPSFQTTNVPTSSSENSAACSEVKSPGNGTSFEVERSPIHKVTASSGQNLSNGSDFLEVTKAENGSTLDEIKLAGASGTGGKISPHCVEISRHMQKDSECSKMKQNVMTIGSSNPRLVNVNCSTNRAENLNGIVSTIKTENICKTASETRADLQTCVQESKCCNLIGSSDCRKGFECKLESRDPSFSTVNFIKQESCLKIKPFVENKSTFQTENKPLDKCCAAENADTRNQNKEWNCDKRNDLMEVKCDIQCPKKPKMELDFSDINGSLADMKVACMPGTAKAQTPVIMENYRGSDNRSSVIKLKDESMRSLKIESTSNVPITYIDIEENHKHSISGIQNCNSIAKDNGILDLKSPVTLKSDTETTGSDTGKEPKHLNCKRQNVNVSHTTAENDANNGGSLSTMVSFSSGIVNLSCGFVDAPGKQISNCSIPTPDKIQFPPGSGLRNLADGAGKVSNEKFSTKQVGNGCAKCKAIAATQDMQTSRISSVTASTATAAAAVPSGKPVVPLISLKIPNPIGPNLRGNAFSAVVNTTEFRMKTSDFCQMCPTTRCASGVPATCSDAEKMRNDMQNGVKPFMSTQKSWTSTAPSRTSSIQCLTDCKTSYSMPGSNHFFCKDSGCMKNNDCRPQNAMMLDNSNLLMAMKQPTNLAFPVSRGMTTSNYLHIQMSGIDSNTGRTSMHNTARNFSCITRDIAHSPMSANIPNTANVPNTANIPNTANVPIPANVPITGLSLLSAMSANAAHQQRINAAQSLKRDSAGEMVRRLGNEAEFTKNTTKSFSGTAAGCCVPKNGGEAEPNKNTTKISFGNTLGCCVPSLYTDTKTSSCIPMVASSTNLSKDILPTPLSCTVGAAALDRLI